MSIIKTQAFFRSTDGKNMSRVLIWKDDETEPSGILQIAHGLTDHIGRYDRFLFSIVTVQIEWVYGTCTSVSTRVHSMRPVAEL